MVMTVVTFVAPYIDPNLKVEAVYVNNELKIYGEEEITAIDLWLEGFLEAVALTSGHLRYSEIELVSGNIAVYGHTPPQTFEELEDMFIPGWKTPSHN